MSQTRFRQTRVGGTLSATIERRSDGSCVLRSTEALGDYPQRLSDRLEHWARIAPTRCFVAQRERMADGSRGEWQRISYAEMLARAQAVGQALVARKLSAERPLVILSDNDLDHLVLMMGALWAGVPQSGVSPAYSIVARDFDKLRHITDKLQPGLVFASDGHAYGKAIRACFGNDVEIALAKGALEGRTHTPLAELLATPVRDEAFDAHAKSNADTIAKFNFTSGSTNKPKAVVLTNRMWSANQQMLKQCLAFLADTPPVLVDWLPWNHTFGGNHNVGIALNNGGTLYVDDGRPTANGIAETLRNLREISPTIYFNVPKGLDEIVSAMNTDAALRDSLYRDLQVLLPGGAGLSQATRDLLDQHAEASVGERIRIVSGLGMSETSPSCMFLVTTEGRAGSIGLPLPGVEAKLVPHDKRDGEKSEVRFRGPNVMPGYWRDEENTAAAFDEEGFYKTGDAAKWADPQDFQKGLMFDGRIAEDFKLSSGSFVSVGPLRARVATLGSPLVQDSVITGLDRDEVGALIIPRIDECRAFAKLPDDSTPDEVLAHPTVSAFFEQLADTLWREGKSNADRVARLHVMSEPPSIDKGELTDKNSINQRAVLTHRSALVDALYSERIERLVRPGARKGVR